MMLALQDVMFTLRFFFSRKLPAVLNHLFSLPQEEVLQGLEPILPSDEDLRLESIITSLKKLDQMVYGDSADYPDCAAHVFTRFINCELMPEDICKRCDALSEAEDVTEAVLKFFMHFENMHPHQIDYYRNKSLRNKRLYQEATKIIQI